MYSGQAITPLLSFDDTNTGSGGARPNIYGNPYSFTNATAAGCPSNSQTLQCWYNPAAFGQVSTIEFPIIPRSLQANRSRVYMATQARELFAAQRNIMWTSLYSRIFS